MANLRYTKYRNEVPLFTPVIKAPDFKDAGSLTAATSAEQQWQEDTRKHSIWMCVGATYQGVGCGKLHAIKDTHAVQTEWYVEPYSCSGGDYYRTGERQLICPSCGVRSRLYEKDTEWAFRGIRSKDFASITTERTG